MLTEKYSCIEDLLMISQSWKTTDIKEIESMIETFSEIIHVINIWLALKKVKLSLFWNVWLIDPEVSASKN